MLYKIFFKKYLGKRKIKVLKYKVESLTSIQFEILLRQLINKDQLKTQQSISNKIAFAIVLIVIRKIKAKKLFASSLRFCNMIKGLKKF